MVYRHLSKLSIKSKVEENKNEKFNNLLDTAFKLFTKNGVNNTSIQEIANKAGVAKGTFYLYFKDKYDLQDYLLVRTSKDLFNNAIEEMYEHDVERLDDKIIFIIDYIIEYLMKHPIIINFIKTNLSLGLYSEKISVLMDDEDLNIYARFMDDIKNNNLEIEDPQVTLYMIVELVSSTVFSSIVNNQPLPIDEYRPILYRKIKAMLK